MKVADRSLRVLTCRRYQCRDAHRRRVTFALAVCVKHRRKVGQDVCLSQACKNGQNRTVHLTKLAR